MHIESKHLPNKKTNTVSPMNKINGVNMAKIAFNANVFANNYVYVL